MEPNQRRMRDGLYRVRLPRAIAGFVIKDGRVTRCAPILRSRIAFYKTIAVRISS